MLFVFSTRYLHSPLRCGGRGIAASQTFIWPLSPNPHPTPLRSPTSSWIRFLIIWSFGLTVDESFWWVRMKWMESKNIQRCGEFRIPVPHAVRLSTWLWVIVAVFRLFAFVPLFCGFDTLSFRRTSRLKFSVKFFVKLGISLSPNERF